MEKSAITEKYHLRADAPIAVFDSGVGGISVLRALVSVMPNENYLYYGDSKNAPYGTKSLEEVRSLTIGHVERFMADGAKAVVVACNTATSAAVRVLREKYPDYPLVGIEPAVKPAATFMDHPTVLVMATPMTIREKKFHDLMDRYIEDAHIIPLPCPGLMEYVERGVTSGDELEHFLEKLFAPFDKSKIQAVVLGCTHYPFVSGALQTVLGNGVTLFDGGVGTAKEAKRRIEQIGLLTTSDKKGTIIFENSLESEERLKKIEICKMLLAM